MVNLYSQIKDAPTALISALQRYQKDYNNLPSIKDKDDYYYQMRAQFNTKIQSSILDSASAALFIFLNKAGFNGLYRVSSNGKFNVPSAHRKSLNLFEEENINNVSLALKNADILCGDFEVACKNVKEKDFVFFDSPYYGTFDTYQSGGFAEKDHRRLFELFKRLSERGTYCLLTNSNTDFIKELYHDYTIDIVDVKRMINADASNRVGQEVIITNY